VIFVAAVALTVAIVTVLKNIFPETRPLGGELDSFPSRHAATAFSAAFFGGWVRVERKWAAPLRAGLYAWAALISFARVLQQAHFVHDVVVGAVVGTAVSYLLSMLARRF